MFMNTAYLEIKYMQGFKLSVIDMIFYHEKIPFDVG